MDGPNKKRRNFGFPAQKTRLSPAWRHTGDTLATGWRQRDFPPFFNQLSPAWRHSGDTLATGWRQDFWRGFWEETHDAACRQPYFAYRQGGDKKVVNWWKPDGYRFLYAAWFWGSTRKPNNLLNKNFHKNRNSSSISINISIIFSNLLMPNYQFYLFKS